MRGLCVALLALALASCDRAADPVPPAATDDASLPSAARAAMAARTHSGPTEEVGFRASWHYVDDDGEPYEMDALVQLGLISFRPFGLGGAPAKITVTEAGRALGLEVMATEADDPFGPRGVQAPKLCAEGFGSVASVGPLAGGPLPAATVIYRRARTAHSALYQRLEGTALRAIAACDPAVAEERRFVMVRRGELWAINRPPVVSARSSRSETSFDHDSVARLIGATTRIELEGFEVSDPDGDPLTVIGWSGEFYSPPDGMKSTDHEITRDGVKVKLLTGDGPKATLIHIIRMGEPTGAKLRYRAKDPWEEGAFTYCIEGYQYGC